MMSCCRWAEGMDRSRAAPTDRQASTGSGRHREKDERYVEVPGRPVESHPHERFPGRSRRRRRAGPGNSLSDVRAQADRRASQWQAEVPQAGREHRGRPGAARRWHVAFRQEERVQGEGVAVLPYPEGHAGRSQSGYRRPGLQRGLCRQPLPDRAMQTVVHRRPKGALDNFARAALAKLYEDARS